LEYDHREGRASVMEAIHMLLAKTGGDLAQEIVSTFFLPVLLVVANDETSECRQIGGMLLSELFDRADAERLQVILKPVKVWLEQVDRMQLVSIGLQAMRIFFEVKSKGKDRESQFVVEVLPSIIDRILKNHDHEAWEVLYFALRLFIKVCHSSPSLTFSKDCAGIWSNVSEALFYQHVWVKTCATNLIGSWLSDLAKAHASSGYGSLPLISEHGLSLDGKTMIQLLRGNFYGLSSPTVSEELALQSVRNITFLCKCLAENCLELPTHNCDSVEEAENEGGPGSSSDNQSDFDSGLTTIHNAAKSPAFERSATHYIFKQISLILHRETVSKSAASLLSKTSAISLLTNICRHLDADMLRPSLPVILLPLQHLTDASIPEPQFANPAFQTSYKSLISNVQGALDLLQTKFGTTEYVEQMTRVQQGIKRKREARRVKRRIDAVAEPEKFSRGKQRKNERKREQRKQKGLEFRDRRRGW
jgi:U3 small nucleolar RNA-associated protein 20